MNILRKHIFNTKFILRASKNNKNLYQVCFCEQYCESKNSDQIAKNVSVITPKYKVFSDEDAPVILDVDEERMKYLESLEETEKKKEDAFCGLNMKRGVNGVYEIEDLVELLKREKMEDIFVASLPKALNYVDYIVVVTGKSVRHMTAVTQIVRKVYKKKMNPSDIIPRIEGETSQDWMALDLGNIALHVFSRKARSLYDLESLWSLGAEYDLPFNKPDDPFIALLQKHSVHLGNLQSTV